MTNGEKIQQDFECEVCEPIIEDDLILVIFANKPYSAIGFDLSWWNMEYNDPTTKNDLGVLDKIRAEIQALSPKPTAYDVIDGNPIKDAVWETIADVLKIIDKYKLGKRG